MNNQNNLMLYISRSCWFCMGSFHLESVNITVPLKDTGQNPQYREELKIKGGMTQVPCLMINDSPLYESDDIIQWFKENY